MTNKDPWASVTPRPSGGETPRSVRKNDQRNQQKEEELEEESRKNGFSFGPVRRSEGPP
jgi:hypothetical protein